MRDGKPLVYDGFCGLGGWAEGFLAEGWHVVGFDIERHDYGTGGYPGELILRDMRTIHGSELADADALVFSPPCQRYSYMAMPWSRAKDQAREIEADTTGQKLKDLNELFETCFRLQREASEAAGRYIPLIVENVRGAQKWVGVATWNCGSMYLWGDVPALMPAVSYVKQPTDPTNRKKVGGWFYDNYEGSARRWSSGSIERKAWSAMIAKIPEPLARHIARTFKPVQP